ncbi:MAG: hypothetical protein CBB87_08215 [Micavibrio sp. TMED27]|nr:hypothetical protein [Micavibrio sp.]OUT90655.1 MAG: hypothetical protein CBB87_08215 [Micavibrio sp. TMED27]|tara:strand:- start:112 stop:489 length:378 start_codon:yes stop_codon:yes gene_type:complete
MISTTKKTKGCAKPLDVKIGTMLRLARLEKGYSQEAFAKKIDLTFQQVQKYEKGINRVSASTLKVISQVLDKPVDYFYGEAIDSSEIPLPKLKVLSRVVTAWEKLPNEQVRAQMLKTIEAIGEAA